MAIIISKDGKKAQKVDKSDFKQEDSLQEYIYKNPESIPLYDIKEDVKLLILAREFPTNSGPIDALGIDKNGNVYLIETKLYNNADKRRVVAQVLDYGASLYMHSNATQFFELLDKKVSEQFNMGLDKKLQDFIGNDETGGTQSIRYNIEKNLSDGSFKFVVLMDKLDDRLKDLIIFINQNSQFDIFAVEMEYYKYESYEIIIPRLYGAEVKKDVGVSTSSGRRNISEESFWELLDKTEPGESKNIRNLIEGLRKIDGISIIPRAASIVVGLSLNKTDKKASLFFIQDDATVATEPEETLKGQLLTADLNDQFVHTIIRGKSVV